MDPLTDVDVQMEHIEEIEKRLLPHEKLSLIFLLYDDVKVALQCAHSLKNEKTMPIQDWVLQHSEKNNKKLYEALAITGNFNILANIFKINKQEANDRYLPKNIHTHMSVSPLRKCLYLLCEQLTEKECKNIVEFYGLDVLKKHTDNMELYSPLNLEFYFLHWLANGEVSSTTEKLTCALKSIDRWDDLKEYIPKDNLQNKIQNSQYIDTKRFYNMDSSNIGYCCIINQKNFMTHEDRIGTDVDRDKLIETFLMYGYEVEVFENLTKKELRYKLRDVAKDRVKESHRSLIMCVLSHGLKDEIFCTDGLREKIDNLKELFTAGRCSPLLSKPKLFLIQACQGNEYQPVVATSNRDDDDYATDAPSSLKSQVVAGNYDDFLTFYSTVPGFVSFRNKLTGSHFINAVCSELIGNSQELPLSSILSPITSNTSNNSIIVDNQGVCNKVTATPENRSTLKKEIKLEFHPVGIVTATRKRMERELFKQVAEQFLLKFCREKNMP